MKMKKRLVGKNAQWNAGQKSVWQKVSVMTVVFCLCFASFAGIGCKNVTGEADGQKTDVTVPLPAELELPAWPPQNESREIYPELVRWEVTCFDGDVVKTFDVAADVAQINLPEITSLVVGVVVQPITRHDDVELTFFYPAGCVYPFDRKINWQDGWVASVANSVAKQLVYGEVVEIEDDFDNAGENGDGKKTEALGTGDAKYILAQFNWEKYLAVIREKTIEDDYGKKIIYDPWANDFAKFAAYIKNSSTKATSKLNDSDKYAMHVQNVFENIQYYREQVNVKPPKKSGLEAGDFSTAKELYMKLTERTKKIAADKMVLSQYIMYQDAMYADQNVWLPYQKNMYFLTSENEIIQLKYMSPDKTNLVIHTPIDYNERQ